MAAGSDSATELVDYRDDDDVVATNVEGEASAGGQSRGYVSASSASFRDFYLKPELVRALADAGFEHPSEVQHEALPHAITNVDLLCQAKSGMGKTAVFVLAILHQISPTKVDDNVYCLVIAHTRELAFQIKNEFERFKKHVAGMRCAVVFGGVPMAQNVAMFSKAETTPHILIGTPGRVRALVKQGTLKTDKIAYFVLDECDKCLEKLDMRADVQDIFKSTPHKKQTMMFSATMTDDMKKVCKRFMNNPIEVCVDDDTKLTLDGLQQYYKKLNEDEKSRVLHDILDKLEFNQVIVFVKNVVRAKALSELLSESSFPVIQMHGQLSQEKRIENYQAFKDFKGRLLVSTDLFARGVDIERVNVVINYDMPADADSYLHRVGRAGRFGTKGISVSFVSSEEDSKVLEEIQSRFEVEIPTMPDTVDTSTYINQ